MKKIKSAKNIYEIYNGKRIAVGSDGLLWVKLERNSLTRLYTWDEVMFILGTVYSKNP